MKTRVYNIQICCWQDASPQECDTVSFDVISLTSCVFGSPSVTTSDPARLLTAMGHYNRAGASLDIRTRDLSENMKERGSFRDLIVDDMTAVK